MDDTFEARIHDMSQWATGHGRDTIQVEYSGQADRQKTGKYCSACSRRSSRRGSQQGNGGGWLVWPGCAIPPEPNRSISPHSKTHAYFSCPDKFFCLLYSITPASCRLLAGSVFINVPSRSLTAVLSFFDIRARQAE